MPDNLENMIGQYNKQKKLFSEQQVKVKNLMKTAPETIYFIAIHVPDY